VSRCDNGPMIPPDEISPGLVVQGFIPPIALKSFKLVALDMDCALVNGECIDEIAAAAGKKDEAAAIKDAASRGEIDHKESLRQRVALLRGSPVRQLEEVYANRVSLDAGAGELLGACKAAGLKVLLVSGGFSFFMDRARDSLGADFTRSNVLEVAGGKLTGRMVDQPWGDICEGVEKRKVLLETCAWLGITPKKAIAIGDAANLPMMGEAGLSVAYHADAKVREQAMVAINEGGLERLLQVLN
jgi:phosphoserine phosphatase